MANESKSKATNQDERIVQSYIKKLIDMFEIRLKEMVSKQSCRWSYANV